MDQVSKSLLMLKLLMRWLRRFWPDCLQSAYVTFGREEQKMPASKFAAITGSTGGIGSAIASQLAANGWGLLLVNRNTQKAEHQRRQLLQSFPDAAVELFAADLMDTLQILRVSQEIQNRFPSIDALYNNSGVLTSQRANSLQGHESNYAVNTLAPYILIKKLRAALSRSEGAAETMIINTTSSAQNAVKSLDVNGLSNPETIGGLTGAYAATKLALTAMGSAMSESLAADGIKIRSVDPGPVVTPMTKTSDAMPGILRLLVPFLFGKPEKQARKMINAANPGEFGGRSGIYISNGKERAIPHLALEPSVQASLICKLEADAVA
ncbi:MAG: SDR family NAD(P)-dependent oxidoreductase [Pseudomonadota bacterium]